MKQISYYIFNITCRSLNILASPAGEGDLLYELRPFIPYTSKESQDVALLLPAIVVSKILIGMVSAKSFPLLFLIYDANYI